MDNATDDEPRDRRQLVLDMLRGSDNPRTVNAIAAELAVHANTVRFHLDALVGQGRVERLLGATGGPGRPPITYRASRSMDPGGPSNYPLLATILADHLVTTTDNPTATATRLGRRWGPRLLGEPTGRPGGSKTAVLDRVGAMLDHLGFAPEPHNGRASKEIRLRHCPFLALVGDRSDVICSLHLGLMQGAMKHLHGPVTVDRLDPFVQPDLCVAHLASTRKQAS